MSNHGKRMVKENLIAQIGQGGGGGTTYTAGDGININSSNVISVDTETIATKEYVDEHGGSGSTFEDYTITADYNVLTQEEAESLVNKIDNLRIIFNYGDNYIYFLLGKTYEGSSYQEYEFYSDLNHTVINPYNPSTVSVTKAVLHVETANYYLSIGNYQNTIVSGTNDGTNWTSLTIGSDTYGLGGIIPEAPTTAGTYKLVATSDGTTVTYTWVSEV